MSLTEEYLVKNLDNLDLIIEQVVSLLPDGYFYKPEINQGVFMDMRNSLEELRRKKRFPAYWNDQSVQLAYNTLYQEYQTNLEQLASRKRAELQEELLSESDEIKCACMLNLISQYRLLKFMRTFD